MAPRIPNPKSAQSALDQSTSANAQNSSPSYPVSFNVDHLSDDEVSIQSVSSQASLNNSNRNNSNASNTSEAIHRSENHDSFPALPRRSISAQNQRSGLYSQSQLPPQYYMVQSSDGEEPVVHFVPQQHSPLRQRSSLNNFNPQTVAYPAPHLFVHTPHPSQQLSSHPSLTSHSSQLAMYHPHTPPYHVQHASPLPSKEQPQYVTQDDLQVALTKAITEVTQKQPQQQLSPYAYTHSPSTSGQPPMQAYYPHAAMAPTFYIQGGSATGGQAAANAEAAQQQETEVEASATAKLKNIVASRGFLQGLLGLLGAGLLWKAGLLTPGNMLQRHGRVVSVKEKQIDMADECIRDTNDLILDRRNQFNPFMSKNVTGWPHNVKTCSRYLERYNSRG